jgi:hypothetical protein
LLVKSAGFGAVLQVVNNLGTTPKNLFSRYSLLCHRSLARRGKNHGKLEKKSHSIMFHQALANVLKSPCFQLFYMFTASAGAGLITMDCSGSFMKLSQLQEDSIAL